MAATAREALAARYPRPRFTDPLPQTFLYLGMTVDPPRRAPRVGASPERARVIRRCHELLDAADGLTDATVFETALIPPLAGVPRFDVVVLARAAGTEALATLRAAFEAAELPVARAMTARNERRIGDTDQTRDATFLLNHFTAPDPDAALGAWEDIARWYTAVLGVDNSTLLRPHEDAPYALINYVRLPGAPVPFLLRQLVTPSYYRHVRRTLAENGMHFLPLLLRPA